MNNQHSSIGILGGSFNPIHIGHIRMSIEIFENFCPKLQYIDLVPCANPPHKNVNSLLPFEMRVEMIKNAINGIDYLKINTNEYLRNGPSYTYDTLLEYKINFSCQELFFIIGEKDFTAIPTWYKGLELPKLTNLIVIAQANYDYINFKQNVFKLWPEAKCDFIDSIPIFSLNETNIFYINLPHLDISSSMIRKHWNSDKNIQYLTPESVIKMLSINEKITKQYWTEL